MEEGRDPASLVITGGATVAYPELGETPGWMSDPASYLTGSAGELGASLAAYRDLGVDHVLTNLYPFTEEAIERYGEAVAVAKGLLAA